MADVVATYGQIAEHTYADSLTEATALVEAVNGFVDAPSEDSLADARKAWLRSREPYLLSEVFRFYGGPIDDDDGPEGLLNAWPLDEAYIDSVAGDEDSGIINDSSKEISPQELVALNEKGGEANIATGFHAIEFLLWGQDHNEDGPGERPATDFLTGEGATLPNGARRSEYLRVTSSLLESHLEEVAAEWSANENNYRGRFENDEPEASLAKILTGMIILSGFETGGERLQAALDSGDQEDEHSCFSDNTHRDMIQDIQGVLNVYEGRYVTLEGEEISGTGIRGVVEELDSELADELGTQIESSLALAHALETPFDRGIALDNETGRQKVADLVAALRRQEGLLEDVFRALGLDVPVAD